MSSREQVEEEPAGIENDLEHEQAMTILSFDHHGHVIAFCFSNAVLKNW